MTTKIEWCSETWNPLAGCTRVSAGCQHCYAERMAKRQIAMGNENYAGTVDKHGRWTGQINLIPDALEKPLHWRKPRRIFVNSMSDLFHEKVPFEYIDKVFAVMALCPQHTFQVLTKRPERMVEYFSRTSHDEHNDREEGTGDYVWEFAVEITSYGALDIDFSDAQMSRFDDILNASTWPLPNVHLGVSVENQETADERIPWLLKTPAAVRWISYEPALGPVEFKFIGCPNCGKSENPWYPNYTICRACAVETKSPPDSRIDGIVMGGESGPGARPMHPDWARSVRDQCQEAGVPFFFKQWGAWWPRPPFTTLRECHRTIMGTDKVWDINRDDCRWMDTQSGRVEVIRIGKKAAGRILDGKVWDELPGQAQGE